MFYRLGWFMFLVGLVYVPVGILLLVAAAVDPATELRMKLLSGSGNGTVGLMLIWLGRRIRNRHDPKRTRIDVTQELAGSD
jgi:Ca2+/Na+ antiporter